MPRPKKPPTKLKSVTVSTRLDVSLKDRIERFAEQDDVELSNLFRKAIREYVERREAA